MFRLFRCFAFVVLCLVAMVPAGEADGTRAVTKESAPTLLERAWSWVSTLWNGDGGSFIDPNGGLGSQGPSTGEGGLFDGGSFIDPNGRKG